MREHAGFWAGVGGSAATLGGILIGIGVVQVTGSTPRSSFWSNGWFVTGIVVCVIGVIALLTAVVMFIWPRRWGTPASPEKQGGVGPTGHLGLKVLRANEKVPEEETNAQWDADCQFVPESLASSFGRGVILSIKNKEGEARDLRCIVKAPDGRRFESAKRIFGSGARLEDQYHFPGEFNPDLGTPWPPGYYGYSWTGETVDIGGELVSDVLARRFFHVDQDGNVTCHKPR